MKQGINLMIALGLSIAVLGSCKKEGCTDEDATNYSKRAKVDDGTCEYDPNVVTQIITENITTNTTIKSKTIEICGNISVEAGLTIEPGAIILMCAGASIDINETGYIMANGTATDPIIIKGKTQTPGFWEGIMVRSNNPNNILNYVTIQDAGSYWGWEYASLYVRDGAKIAMTHSTISGSENNGLYLQNGSNLGEFSNNSFVSNANIGMYIPSNIVHKMAGNSTFSGNGENYIHVLDNDVNQNVTWPKTIAPLLLNGSVYISAGLTLSPGSNLLMEAESTIYVETTGFLTCEGNASNAISIQGRYSTPGFWSGIVFNSNNPNNKMNYTTIKDGGNYWGYDYCSIQVAGSLEIDNSTVTNSNSWGVIAKSSSTIKTGGVAQTNASGVTTSNNLSGNGMGADADCAGGGCSILFE